MTVPSLDVSAASIVLVGSFNPAIFQPEWFARNGLLPQGEVADATVQVIHPQVCQFETERFVFQVTLDRFSAQTKPNTTGGPLRDLVLGAFYILEHTPVTAIGINRMMHFPTGSEEAWHRLGDKLAPKDPWSAVLEGRPGLRTLEILAQKDPTSKNAVMVRVQPSVIVPLGAYFEINEHYSTAGDDGLKSAMKILQDRWEEAQTNGENVARHILTWAVSSS